LSGDGAERLRNLGQTDNFEFYLQNSVYEIIQVYNRQRKGIITLK